MYTNSPYSTPPPSWHTQDTRNTGGTHVLGPTPMHCICVPPPKCLVEILPQGQELILAQAHTQHPEGPIQFLGGNRAAAGVGGGMG